MKTIILRDRIAEYSIVFGAFPVLFIYFVFWAAIMWVVVTYAVFIVKCVMFATLFFLKYWKSIVAFKILRLAFLKFVGFYPGFIVAAFGAIAGFFAPFVPTCMIAACSGIPGPLGAVAPDWWPVLWIGHTGPTPVMSIQEHLHFLKYRDERYCDSLNSWEKVNSYTTKRCLPPHYQYHYCPPRLVPYEEVVHKLFKVPLPQSESYFRVVTRDILGVDRWDLGSILWWVNAGICVAGICFLGYLWYVDPSLFTGPLYTIVYELPYSGPTEYVAPVLDHHCPRDPELLRRECYQCLKWSAMKTKRIPRGW